MDIEQKMVEAALIRDFFLYTIHQEYPHHWGSSHGKEVNGKFVQYFYNKFKPNRTVGVYLKNDILYPYFN